MRGILREHDGGRYGVRERRGGETQITKDALSVA